MDDLLEETPENIERIADVLHHDLIPRLGYGDWLRREFARRVLIKLRQALEENT